MVTPRRHHRALRPRYPSILADLVVCATSWFSAFACSTIDWPTTAASSISVTFCCVTSTHMRDTPTIREMPALRMGCGACLQSPAASSPMHQRKLSLAVRMVPSNSNSIIAWNLSMAAIWVRILMMIRSSSHTSSGPFALNLPMMLISGFLSRDFQLTPISVRTFHT